MSELPPKTVALFKDYLKEAPQSPAEIAKALDDYLEFAGKVKEKNPNVNLALAEQMTKVLKELLTCTPEGKHKYVQAAARYFIEDLDAESDLLSPSGFDDDVKVVNSVAEHFGRPDLVIQ